MSKLEGTNRVGRCTRCDKQIYKFKTAFPIGHPYEGDAMTVGDPLPDLRIVTLILMNGHQCNITMCNNCLTQSETPRWSHVWKKLLRTWQLEMSDEFKLIRNCPPLNQKQKSEQKEWFEKMIYNVPVGVLTVRKHAIYSKVVIGDQNG